MSFSDRPSDQLYREGTKLALNKQYNEALQVFYEVTQLDPRNDQAWVAKGVVQSHLTNYQAAYQSFGEALKINPNNKRAKDNQDVVISRIELEMPVFDSPPSVPSPILPQNPIIPEPVKTVPPSTPIKNSAIPQSGIGAMPYQIAAAIDVPVNAISSAMGGVSFYQVVRAFIFGVVGGFGIASIIFPISAFIFLRWPFYYVLSMFIIWGIIGGIILKIVGHYWEKTDPVIKKRVEPVFAITAVVFMVADVIITTVFYMH